MGVWYTSWGVVYTVIYGNIPGLPAVLGHVEEFYCLIQSNSGGWGPKRGLGSHLKLNV